MSKPLCYEMNISRRSGHDQQYCNVISRYITNSNMCIYAYIEKVLEEYKHVATVVNFGRVRLEGASFSSLDVTVLSEKF